jgi:hypothetical protein
MRLSSQNNQFQFNFPNDFVNKRIHQQFEKLMIKNFIPYDSVLDYVNSTIRELSFPSSTFNTVEQLKKYGKKIQHKEAGNAFDKFNSELDITFRSVDSWLNYFIILQIMYDFYLDNTKQNIPLIILEILDKSGDLIYTVLFKEVIFKSISEIRFNYNSQEISDQTFNISFTYNYIDILWELDDDDERTSTSIFDLPIIWTPGKLDKEFNNFPYKNMNKIKDVKKY